MSSRRIGKKQCIKWTDIWIQTDERKQYLFNKLKKTLIGWVKANP